MGLLDQLDIAIDGLDLDAIVSGPVGQLSGLGGQVGGLISGPTELSSLLTMLQNPPTPSGLGGLGQLQGGIAGLGGAFPLELTSAFAPLLGPLRGLTELSITASGATSVTAAFDLFRRVSELVSERFARAQPFPGLFGADSGLDLEGVRASFDHFEQ